MATLPQFDDTLPALEGRDVSPSSRAEFDEVFSLIESRLADHGRQQQVERVEPTGKGTAYRTWRDATARPTLSAIAHRLKNAGHAARVVVRSATKTETGWAGTDSIELRAKLQVASRYNPSYYVSAHLRYGLTRDGESCVLDVDPYDVRFNGKELRRAAFPLEALTDEAIEKHAIATFQHVAQDRY